MAKLFTERFAFAAGDSVVVIGLGRFGGAVAQSLMRLGHDVMGIDRDAEPVQAWADRLTHAVQADANNETVLRQLGVADFSHAIIGIGDNLASSLMTLMTLMALTELGIGDIWVKALTEDHGKIAQRMGAHHVVYPEADMGEREKFGITVVGIKRPGSDFQHARPDSRVQPGDLLIVSGPTDQVEKFAGRAKR